MSHFARLERFACIKLVSNILLPTLELLLLLHFHKLTILKLVLSRSGQQPWFVVVNGTEIIDVNNSSLGGVCK